MAERDVGAPNGSTDRLLGELIAEIRALKHSENNTGAKVDAIGRQVAPIPALIDQVKEIKDEQEKHHFRIAILEADKNRREGAVGLVEWIARHWPFSLLLAALAGWVAWANGKV
jgi:hypothetical protein